MISDALDDLMPRPAEVEARDGVYQFSSLSVSDALTSEGVLRQALQRVVSRLEARYDRSLPLGEAEGEAALRVLCDGAEAAVLAAPMPDMDESYKLSVSAEGVQIDAACPIGVLRAFQTLYQLVRPSEEGWVLPCCEIVDRPRFSWRGVLLDVSRHFMSVADVERLLDGMEIAKLNVLHFHLANDQGFRLECKVHPRLHELGSEGEYYTQAEMRGLIEAASARGIRVVPEFCLPGHSVSWQVAYPELSASPEPPTQVGELRDIFSIPVDPTREALYGFVDAFVAEMAALFPDPYFHTGGDEVNPTAWKNNPSIQAFMRERGMASHRDLQAYFTGRYVEIVRAHGKTAIGWEEILHADVDSDVLIHLWRDGSYPQTLARHPVLVSWNYYLDLQQPAEWLYGKDPLDFRVKGHSADKLNVLGAEMANWSETIDGNNLDQRTWPRGMAMAERFWSPRGYVDGEGRDSLYRRLDIASGLLRAGGLRHETHLVHVMADLYGAEGGAAFAAFAALIEPAAYPFVRRRRLLLEQTLPKFFKPPQVQRYSNLRRFVDQLRPESAEGRLFSEDVRTYLDTRDAALGAALRRQLRDWQQMGRVMAMHASHVSSMKREGLHRVALGLAIVAQAGLASLDALERDAPMGWFRRRFWQWRLWPYAYDIFFLDKDLLKRIVWEMRKPDVLNRHHVAIYPGVAHLLSIAGKEG